MNKKETGQGKLGLGREAEVVKGSSKWLNDYKTMHCVLGSGVLSQPVGVWADFPEVVASGLRVEREMEEFAGKISICWRKTFLE